MSTQAKDMKVEKTQQADVELAQDKPVFTPATDIYETKDDIEVIADMPGVTEKNINITLENDVLTITGSQTEKHPEAHELLHCGYGNGIFRRSFTLTEKINRDAIKAVIKNGVLKISLPKAEETKPKQIAVEAGE